MERKCTYCQTDLAIGVKAIEVREGLVSPKRFVPLGEQMLFCSDECIRCHYNGGDEVVEPLP